MTVKTPRPRAAAGALEGSLPQSLLKSKTKLLSPPMLNRNPALPSSFLIQVNIASLFIYSSSVFYNILYNPIFLWFHNCAFNIAKARKEFFIICAGDCKKTIVKSEKAVCPNLPELSNVLFIQSNTHSLGYYPRRLICWKRYDYLSRKPYRVKHFNYIK